MYQNRNSIVEGNNVFVEKFSNNANQNHSFKSSAKLMNGHS